MSALLYFILWAALLFLMMRFGCGSHVTGHGHGAGPAGGRGAMPPEKAVDPVCGMTVYPATAKPSVYAGSIYYFCSPDCRDKFEASPSGFIDRGGKTLPTEHHHG